MATADNAQSILPSNSWRRAAQCLLAIAALALVTFVAWQFQPNALVPTTAALLYLIIVVLLSLNGSFVLAAIVSIIAVLCLDYFVTPPLLSFSSFGNPMEALALAAFLTAALVITRLVARMRSALRKLHASMEERKRAEEATRRQAALLDLTHDTVFVRDVNDVITFWNRGAQELYGWTVNEAVGRVAHDLLQTEFPAPLDEITTQLIRTGRWEGELTHTRRDGSKVVVASRWSLQRNEQAQPVATLETNNDITARKRAEEELLRAQTELVHVTRVTTLGELAASIAHEVNQPLTAIVADANAALNWLAMENANLDTVRETMAAIVKDSERAAEVLTRIRGLLSRSSHPFERCDLCSVIEDALPLVRSDFARHGIRVQTSLANERPPVMGDRIQLEQVLLNLLMNAADASKEVAPERRQLLVTAAVEQGSHGPRAVVEVRDEGVGLREADSDRLFDAFYTTKSGGLGMGLSISRSIIERHGGQLWVTANSDYGATFRFALPALP